MPAEGCETCRGDMWMGAAQTSAAHNARLCEIALAADRLLEELEWLDRGGGLGLRVHERIRTAIDAFKIVRRGQ